MLVFRGVYILVDLVGLSPSNVTDDADASDASASDDSPAIGAWQNVHVVLPQWLVDLKLCCLLCTEYFPFGKRR